MRLMKNMLLVIAVFFIAFAKAQTTKSKLEQRKQEIQREISQLDKVLSKTRGQEEDLLTQVQTLNSKISKAEEVMAITVQQVRSLNREIEKTESDIERLEKEIEIEKEQYARAITSAYRSNNQRSRLMFLLSSENFLQAYKRLKYLKSYADYRKRQAARIEENKIVLEEKVKKLEQQRKKQQQLLVEQRELKRKLEQDQQEQEVLLAEIKKEEKKYIAQIRQKQKERNKIEAQIRKIVEEEIARANRGKAGASSEEFVLTPEAKALAADFAKNRGKLPWPVDKGVISQRYGKQPHPIVPTIEIMANGIRIQSPENTKARAVFKGEVMRVERGKNGILSVFVRHGNYITIYRNLKSIAVQKGQQVSTYDTIGTVFTDRKGVTELQFVVMKNTTRMNPSGWIVKG